MEKKDFVKWLNTAKPIEIADNDYVKQQFVKTYCTIHGVEEAEAEAFHSKEKGYFNSFILDEKAGISKCTPISILSAFMEIAINGLSVKKQSQAEAYIEKRSSCVKSAQGDTWINTAYFCIQAHGELALRKRAGQILHCSNPVTVWENDSFSVGTNDNGDLIVKYNAEIPRTSNKIKGCWCKLILKHNIVDYKYFLPEDWERLRKKSAKSLKNDKGNALYSDENGQIDEGFLHAKLLKHSFKTLPKIKISSNALFEEEIIDDDDNTQASDFGYDSGENIPKAEAEEKKSELFPDDDSPF